MKNVSFLPRGLKSTNIYILDPTYIYVHTEGYLFQRNLRNSIFQLKKIDYVEDIDVEVRVKKRIPSMDCTDKIEVLDSCFEKTYGNENYCLFPPLSPENKNKSVHQNFEECGLESESLFPNVHDYCKPPCHEVRVDIPAKAVNWLYSVLHPNNPVKTLKPGYYLRIPSTVLVSEMQESYTIISVIGEFGGWVGLFLGASMMGFCQKIPTMSRKCHNLSALHMFRILLLTGALAIIVKCYLKLVSKGKYLDITTEDTINNVSISLCSMENAYSGVISSYVGNDSNFWNKVTKLKRKVQQIKFILQNRESFVMYDSNNDSNFDYVTYSINTPRFQTFLETCHTLDLSNWSLIKSIQIQALTDLIIYVHATGQLMRSGRQGYSYICSDTVDTG